MKVALAVILLAHGIGHSLGLLQVFKVAVVNPGWNGDSWLLTGPAGATVTNAVGIVLWSASIVGFAALAATVLGWLPASLFNPLAIGSALVSLLGLALFPIAFPIASSLGALAVDLGVIAAVTLYHLQPSDLA